jgi:hypothetical protein
VHDRRGAVRFVTFAVAALAVAGTSAATPPPPPAQPLSTSGTVHLTAEQPVAIQPISFAVERGQPTSITLAPTLGDASTKGTYLASIVRIEPAGTLRREPTTGIASEPPVSDWSFDCTTNPCANRYALVVSWLDAPKGGTSDVPWTVAANVTFVGTIPGGATPGAVTADAEASDPGIHTAAALSTLTGGPAVRLTETDRVRTWTVHLSPTVAPGAGATGWPSVVQARLSLDAEQVAGEPITFGADGQPVDRRAQGRAEPPVQVRLATSDNRGMIAWASGRAIEFDPFLRCARDQPCDTTLTIDVVWADGRPESAFDAGWRLDLVSIDAEGKARPVEASVEAVDPVRIATATASGTFQWPGPAYEPQVRFSISAPALHRGEDVVAPPARARATVTATSVGSMPLPSDAVISIYASGPYDFPGGGVMLRPGETGTFAFELRGVCGQGLAHCKADGTLGGIIYSPNRNTANIEGMAVRIDWAIDAGIGTPDDGTAAIEIEPTPTRAP